MMNSFLRSKTDRLAENTLIVSFYIIALAMPFSISMTQIFFGLALCAWLYRVLITRRATLLAVGLESGFLFFLIAVMVALFFSTNMRESVVFLKRLLLIPMVYLFALNLASPHLRQRLILTFAISLTLYASSGLVTYVTSDTVRLRHFQNSMTTGGITMFAALISWSFVLVSSAVRERWLFSLAAVLNSAALLLTSTRSSWLGFFGGLLYLIFYTKKRYLLLLPLLAAAFYLLTPDSIRYHIDHFFNPLWGTNAERLVMWQTGWKIFLDHPLVGIGDVSAQAMFQKYMPPDFTYLIGHFHSNIVHIAVTLGFIGLAAFCFMMIQIYRSLSRQVKKHRAQCDLSKIWPLAALAAFVAFHINGLFEWTFGDAEIITMIWFMVGVTCSFRETKSHVTVSDLVRNS